MSFFMSKMIGKSGDGPVSVVDYDHPDRLWTYTLDNADRQASAIEDATGSLDATAFGSIFWRNGAKGQCAEPDGTTGYIEPPAGVQGVNIGAFYMLVYVPVDTTTATPAQFYSSLTGETGWMTTGSSTSQWSDETFAISWVNNAVTSFRTWSIAGQIDKGWHVFGFDWNGSGYDIILDGVRKTTRTAAVGSPPAANVQVTSNIRLMRRTGGFSSTYSSMIHDEVGMFNRGLTDAEWSELATALLTPTVDITDHRHPDLRGRWSGYEVAGSEAVDQSKYLSDGTIDAGITYTDGERGSAWKFDASGDDINMGDINQMDFASDFSIAALVRTSDATKNKIIVDKRYEIGPGIDGYFFAVKTDGTLGAWVSNGTSAAEANSTTTVNDGNYHVVFAQYDRDGNSEVYVDAGPAEGATDISTIAFDGAQTADFMIGNKSPQMGTTSVTHMLGDIGEVWVYNKLFTALDRTNILNYMMPGSALISDYWHPDLIAYWSMDDSDFSGTTIYDKSAYANNGTIGAGITTGQVGAVGEAMKGDGSGIITINSNIGISGNQARAWSFWAKKGASTAAMAMIGSGSTGTVDMSRWNIDTNINNQGQVYLECDNGDYYTGGGLIDDGNWHHIVVQYDGTTHDISTIQIWVDAVQQSLTKVGSDTGELHTTDENYRIFANSSGGGQYDGSIDDVRAYKRDLTSGEISDLKALGPPA